MEIVRLSTAGRTCQTCGECCVHLGIAAGGIGEGAKPAGVPCRYRCAAGCAIYQRRPTLCREFACAWLADPDWPEAWRPELSGMLCIRETLEEGLTAGVIYEVRGGALQSAVAEEIIDAMLRATVVTTVVSRQNLRRTIFGDQAMPEQRQPMLVHPALVGRLRAA